MTKADRAAATRVLTANVRRAITLIRDGKDPRPLLAAAVIAADVLLEGAGQ